MKIIDSHIHFWDISNGYNDWVKSTDLPSIVIPDSIIETNSFVHIEAHTSNHDSLCDYNWLKSKFPEKNIKVVAFIDFLSSLEEFEKKVSILAKKNDIVGIRQIMAKTYKSRYSPFDNCIPYDLCEKLIILKSHNLIFEAQLYPEQFLPLLNLIDKSGVKMAIEHFGLPIFGENNNLVEWHTLIQEISQHKRWYLKLSGFDLNNDFKLIYKSIDFILNNISSNQLCYGSNYPVSHSKSYSYWYNLLLGYIKGDKIIDDIFFNSAAELYGFKEVEGR